MYQNTHRAIAINPDCLVRHCDAQMPIGVSQEPLCIRTHIEQLQQSRHNANRAIGP